MAAEATTDLWNPVVRPPRYWQTRTVAVLAALAVSVLTSLLSLVLDVLNWRSGTPPGTTAGPL